jgi:hypothetical protein
MNHRKRFRRWRIRFGVVETGKVETGKAVQSVKRGSKGQQAVQDWSSASSVQRNRAEASGFDLSAAGAKTVVLELVRR